MVAQRERAGAHDEVVDADLRAFDVHQLLAYGQEARYVEIDGEIEVRNGTGGLGESLRDRAAHRGERDVFFFERRGRGQAGAAFLNWTWTAKALHVFRDDAALRTAALKRLERDSELAGHFSRERRGTLAGSGARRRGRRCHMLDRLRAIAARTFCLDGLGVLTGGFLDAVFLIGGAALRFIFLARAENSREEAADGNDLSFLRSELAESAVTLCFEIEIHFVRLDLGDGLPFLHCIARLLVPTDDLPLGHRVAHLGHDHFAHARPPRSEERR